jgi:hypothetical protein
MYQQHICRFDRYLTGTSGTDPMFFWYELSKTRLSGQDTIYSRRKEKHEIIRSNQNRHSTYRTRNRVRQQQKKQARTWGEVSPSPGQSKRKAPADTQTQTLKLTSNYAQQKTAHMHTHIIQDRALPCTIINRDVYEFVAVFVRMICITRLPAIES